MHSKRFARIAVHTALVTLAILSTSSAQGGDADPKPQVIEIHAKKFGYEPAEVTLHKAQVYKLHLTSEDVPHSLRIKALNLNAAMKPEQFNDVLFSPDQSGDFKADCGIYCGAGHMKMALTVHVVE
ncbi:MAG: cupredoxin domain-containing protein [Candidatus Sulfotelmatobacter sp.]